jgi:hypothetical protein
MIYARINPDTTLQEVRDFAAEPSFAKGWRPLTIEAQPTPSATQYVAAAPIVFGQLTATQGWVLLDKSADQIEAEEVQAAKAGYQAHIDALNVQLDITNAMRGAMTTNQRLNTLEADTRATMRAVKDLLRQAKRAL